MPSNAAKISVIIPLFNKARSIRRAVESVLCQTYEDLELIVVDDGSTDKGPSEVQALSDPRLRLVTQQNLGVSAARNLGISIASGELVALLDADDWWTRDHLERLLDLRTRFPGAGLYSTSFRYSTGEGIKPMQSPHGVPSAQWCGLLADYFQTAAQSPPVCSSSVAIPRSVVEHVGPFTVGARAGEDLDMWGRVACHYPVAFCWGGEAVVQVSCEQQAWKKDWFECSPFLDFCNRHPDIIRDAAKRSPGLLDYIAKMGMDDIYRLMKAGRFATARILFQGLDERARRHSRHLTCRLFFTLPPRAGAFLWQLWWRLVCLLRRLKPTAKLAPS